MLCYVFALDFALDRNLSTSHGWWVRFSWNEMFIHAEKEWQQRKLFISSFFSVNFLSFIFLHFFFFVSKPTCTWVHLVTHVNRIRIQLNEMELAAVRLQCNQNSMYLFNSIRRSTMDGMDWMDGWISRV